jgi:hypothetical protein
MHRQLTNTTMTLQMASETSLLRITASGSDIGLVLVLVLGLDEGAVTLVSSRANLGLNA